MILKGLQKTTLLDYPGKLACTVFTGGCNFRCPFCHNAALVERPTSVDNVSTEEFFKYIAKRSSLLDGVCITGGEPLLRKDFFEIMGYARSLGFHWGMTSNGTLITKDVARKLTEAGMGTISISLDGLKESHDAFRRTPGGFDRALEGNPARNLVMDLSGVSFMDSSGIALLLRAHRRAREVGGTLRVQGTPEQAMKVLRSAGLHKLMKLEG